MSGALDLGTIGVWTTYRAVGEENAGDAARLVEELGYGTFWLGGSPRLAGVRPLLEATERLVVATGIVNVWAYDPAQLADEYAALAREFPDRLFVGIGIGHPEATSDYSHPFTAMGAFLDGIDRAESPLPRNRRCLAALAPKMLMLSAERSVGAIPYFVPVAHTRSARTLLGPDPLLMPEVAFVLDEETVRARETARGYARTYLGLRNYTDNLLRNGFSPQDLADGGSDRLIDEVIPHGSADRIAAAIRLHFAAGANHVALQAIGEDPRPGWATLAEALTAY